MKKLLCLVLALVLCLASACAAAEATETFSAEDVTVTIPQAPADLGKVELGGAAKALKSTDEVANNNGVYTVKTASGLTIKLDASNLPYLVLTQNYYASLDIYSRFPDDATATEYIDNLINDQIHYLIWDAYDAFQFIAVRTLGSDRLSQHVRNLNMLNENEINAVASAIASASNLEEYYVYTLNGQPWIQLASNVLITMANSEYVQVIFMPNGETMTEDDYTDFTEFVNALSVN